MPVQLEGTLKMCGSALSLFAEWDQSRVGVQRLVLDVVLVEIQGFGRSGRSGIATSSIS